jgi:Patatin-like phospholipase
MLVEDGIDPVSESEAGPGGEEELVGAPANGAQPEQAPGIGICLSGGGIRAAAFGLGALQVLDERGILRRADFLAGVSGGSYIVGAMTLVEKGPIARGEEDRDGNRVIRPDETQPSFSHGSPEERHLRQNLDYLTSGPGGLAAVLVRACYGFLLNIFFLGLTLWVPSLMLGWLYGWRLLGLRYKQQCGATAHCVTGFHGSLWVWAIAAALGGVGIVAGLLWVGIPIRTRSIRQRVGAISGAFVALAAAILILGIGIPYLLEFIRGAGSSAVGGSVPNQSAATTHSSGPLAVGTLAGLGGLLATTVGVVRHVLTAPTEAEKAVTSWIGKIVTKHKGLLLSIVAAISVPLFALASAILVINWGAAHPPFASGAGTPWVCLAWGILPLAVWIAIVTAADVNTWSLHPYYKQHLSQAFALARVRDDEGREKASERVEEMPYRISLCQPDSFPRFLICATANVSDRTHVPTGFDALPFVFSADVVDIPGVARVRTADYEDRAEYRVTVPTAMAVSGAAFSPEMGTVSRRPLRALMTLANVRLGVWLPNPNVPLKPGPSPRHWYFRAPRPYYLFAELFSRTRIESRYLYVTDGGHYDNLGLVEILRRRCRSIICVDASGEKINSFGTIGKALAIARAENLIDSFDLDPRRDLAPPPETPTFVRSSYCFGTVVYPDGSSAELTIIKAGVTVDAPWDVRSYHESDPRFPCDSTLDQFYTAPRFDAYRTLGEFSTGRAVDSRLRQRQSTLLRLTKQGR